MYSHILSQNREYFKNNFRNRDFNSPRELNFLQKLNFFQKLNKNFTFDKTSLLDCSLDAEIRQFSFRIRRMAKAEIKQIVSNETYQEVNKEFFRTTEEKCLIKCEKLFKDYSDRVSTLEMVAGLSIILNTLLLGTLLFKQ